MIVLDLSILNQKGTPMFYSDVFANRPPAGVVGRMFISTDTFAFYRDTGTGWDLIGGPGTGTITGSGTATQVAFFSGASSIGSDSNLYWDNTNKYLGIGTSTPGVHLDIHGTGVIAQFNGTGTTNSFLSFQNAGTNKWRIGNAYQAGANYFQIYDFASSIQRLRWDNTGAAEFAGDFTFTASTTNNVATFKATQPNVTIESTGVTNPASLSFNPSTNFASVIQASNTGGYFEFKTNNITSLYIGNNQQVVVGGGPIGNSLFEVIGNADIRNSYTQGPGSFVTGLQSYTISTTPGSSAYSAGTAYVAFNGSFQNNFGGSNTLPNSIYMAGVRANAALGFTANSTISVSQGTGVNLRSISNVVSQLSIPTNGAGSTISHASGMHIYSPILAGTSPTFTNYYGLAINDSAEYSPTITNRWGIYQVGTTDKNYFAANVLIGSTTDSGEKLQISGNVKATGYFNSNDGTRNVYLNPAANFGVGSFPTIQVASNHNLQFATNNTLWATLTNSGNFGIGTSSPGYKLTVNGESVVQTASGVAASMGVFQNGWNKWNFLNPANSIDLHIDENGVVRTVFKGTSGNVLIGSTTDSGHRLRVSGSDRVINCSGSGGGANSLILFSDGGTSRYSIGYNSGNFIIYDDAVGYRFLIDSTGKTKVFDLGTGTVYSNAGVLTNTNPSDARLKTNITPIDYGLNEILKLNPVTFDWKEDKNNQGKQFGFIAQEVKEVMPELVKDGEYLGLDKEAIFTILVKAIQELKQEINSLKN